MYLNFALLKLGKNKFHCQENCLIRNTQIELYIKIMENKFSCSTSGMDKP